MLAEIELDNATHGFQPGSYARVTLTTPQDNTAWTIPTNTLQMRVDGTHVAIVGDDNHVEMKPVTLGRNLGARVVVVEGIRGNERLIVNPSDTLTSGTGNDWMFANVDLGIKDKTDATAGDTLTDVDVVVI